MLPELKQYLVAALGALLLEIAYWYELRRVLEQKKYTELMTLAKYWGVTILMIVLSPIAVVIWFEDAERVALKTYLITGAAFPHIFKNAVAALWRDKNTLGFDSLRTYFMKR